MQGEARAGFDLKSRRPSLYRSSPPIGSASRPSEPGKFRLISSGFRHQGIGWTGLVGFDLDRSLGNLDCRQTGSRSWSRATRLPIEQAISFDSDNPKVAGKHHVEVERSPLLVGQASPSIKWRRADLEPGPLPASSESTVGAEIGCVDQAERSTSRPTRARLDARARSSSGSEPHALTIIRRQPTVARSHP